MLKLYTVTVINLYITLCAQDLVPETDDIQTNHRDEPLQHLRVEIKRELQQSHDVCGEEENDCNDQLREQEEQRYVCLVQHPFVAEIGVSIQRLRAAE